MKGIIVSLVIIIWAQDTVSPVGIWVFREDNSRLEIKGITNALFGELISSDNPHRAIGKEVIKNLRYREGIWKGQYYLYKIGSWVNASIEVKGTVLIVRYQYGFQNKVLRFYSGK